MFSIEIIYFCTRIYKLFLKKYKHSMLNGIITKPIPFVKLENKNNLTGLDKLKKSNYHTDTKVA